MVILEISSIKALFCLPKDSFHFLAPPVHPYGDSLPCIISSQQPMAAHRGGDWISSGRAYDNQRAASLKLTGFSPLLLHGRGVKTHTESSVERRACESMRARESSHTQSGKKRKTTDFKSPICKTIVRYFVLHSRGKYLNKSRFPVFFSHVRFRAFT